MRQAATAPSDLERQGHIQLAAGYLQLAQRAATYEARLRAGDPDSQASAGD
jgi:hypothetical protein